MSFYADLAADAQLLLAEFGQVVTIRRKTTGEYDPETGSASVTTVDQPGYGCVFDFGLYASGQSFTAGSMIVAGDKQLLLSPVGMAAPTPGNIAVIGGETWSIVSVKVTAPAGVAVIYECQLRR